MSTALSWTELRSARQDLASLLAFRRSGMTRNGRRRLLVMGGLVLGLTVAAAVGPAYLGGEFPRPNSGRILALFPTAALGFLVLSSFTAVATAGGREVVPRDQIMAFPVSATTDHLGALVLAPLNIAWVMQAWLLIGVTSYALGPGRMWAFEIPVVLWIVAATALAQVVGWLSEGVRRGRHGIGLFRVLVGFLAVTVGVLIVTGRLTPLLDHSPTSQLLVLVLDPQAGRWGSWLLGVAVIVALALAAVVLGAVPARWALQRPMREELRLESGHVPARATAASDFAMLLRIDRAAVWRSVPLRRGMTVLAVMPGAVALAGDLEWRMLTVLPGLVASGGALLFGVNTWCLDGRGALWRDSLPASPRASFLSRAVVLMEVLLCSAALTIALAALRAGRPTTSEVVALLCSTIVVCVQVIGASMRWSIARPYAVDLRSARATPAPPVVMAGYSARLAVITTITGLVFSGLAQVEDPRYALCASVIFLIWSTWRLRGVLRRWQDPVVRSRVIATVAG